MNIYLFLLKTKRTSCSTFAAMKRFLLISLHLSVLLATACDRNFWLSRSEDVDYSGSIPHEMIVLGDKLDDPYTVANMTKACASLYPAKAGRGQLLPTHFYVRFLPSDDDQYERLVNACGNLLDHPMDYEVVREGDWYHDPEVSEDRITWQYTVVPEDFMFPSDIRYELLDSCYIPDSSTKGDGIDWAAVEREAFRMTGNEQMLLSSGTKASEGSKVPAGRITVSDPDYSSEPAGLKGALVSCNTFVKFCNVYTDEDGNYQMTKSFASEPRYRIIFKNVKGFGIGFNLLLLPASASTLGKCSNEGVDVEISAASERKMFLRAAVNNAAYDYWESCKSTDGNSISTPPSNLRIWLFHSLARSSSVMLQQGAFVDSSFIGNFLGEYVSLLKMFLPDITIGVKQMNSYAEVYATTVHELAHASHFAKAGKTYWDEYIKYIMKSFVTSGFVTYGVGTEENSGYCEVGEMWAYYMETKMYRERYAGSDKVFGTSYWFSPQILMNLDDKGLDRYHIFQALGTDVVDKDVFQDKMLSLYPQFKANINQAFGRYN